MDDERSRATKVYSRVGVHDSKRLELRLDYPGGHNSSYRLDAYIYLPKSLGIGPQTYPSAQFYADLRGHVRFREPELPLSALEGGDDAPLDEIKERLRRLRATSGAEVETSRELMIELKIFATAVRANLRSTISRLRQLLPRVSDKPIVVGDVDVLGQRLVRKVRKLLKHYRKLRPEVMAGDLPREVPLGYERIDEYVSLEAESQLTELLVSIDQSAVADDLQELRAAARALLLAERAHRVRCGYPTVLNDDPASHEHFVRRRGRLKKLATSVLWLDIKRSREGRRSTHLIGGVAAGVAMAFAVLATIYSSQLYVLNSWPFVVAAVGIYILKDRIKDGLKAYFSARLTGWLADYSVEIRDPISGESIGRCREASTFLRSADVPPAIHQQRHPRHPDQGDSDGKPETVLKYEKQIQLRGRHVIRRLHRAEYTVIDIIRFDLSAFLRRADDAKTTVRIFDEGADRVVERQLPKVYHINIVLAVYWSIGGTSRKELRHVRVVADRERIRRIEAAR
ncbi:MAG: hypothetical protein CSA65_02135 [Proteobacteria bacterium]|nr:MAG: hypothetical protein CSA65_02135 [Pseudomonadota bacterium]